VADGKDVRWGEAHGVSDDRRPMMGGWIVR
jgi:hypothetical protein